MPDDHLGNQLMGLYKRFDVPSDRIAQDQTLRSKFLQFVNEETGAQHGDKSVIERLIALRKQGKLPRLRR